MARATDLTATDTSALSHIQEQMWLVEQLTPGQAPYSEAVALRVRGPLARDVLDRALAELVRRHEILRTAMPVVEGRVVQQAADPPARVLQPAGLRGEEDAGRAVQRLVEQPFDRETGPLFRCWLLEPAAGEHVLVLNVDHIVADAASFAIVLDELQALYEAFLRGEPSPLPEPELQYADFAHWERDLVEGGVLERDAGYWREQLAGVPPFLELPSRLRRPAVKDVRGRRAEFPLGDHLGDRVLDAARRSGVTPFTVLLAAYAGLLDRYARRADVVVGTPALNRGRPELERMIGNFANTLPLRVDLGGDPDWAAVLERSRDRCLEALEHQHLALGKIVELVGPGRDPAHPPLIQHTLVMKEMPLRSARLGEAELAWLEIPRDRGRLDTIVEVDVAPGRLRAWVEYDDAVHDAEGIAGLMGDYARALEAWLAEPALRVSELPVDPPEPLAELPAAAPQPGAAAASGALLDFVAGVWAEATGTPHLTPDDDFFRLGGHSMMAARLVQRLRDAFQIDLPLRTLFENSTLGGFTAELQRLHPELDFVLEQMGRLSSAELEALLGADEASAPAAPERRGRTAPMSFAQQHFWYMEQVQPGTLTHTIPFAFRFRGEFDPDAYRDALNEVVARHEGLRTTFGETQEGPVQRVAPALVLDIPMLDLTSRPPDEREAEADRLKRVAVYHAFDLEEGPLVRSVIVRVEEDDHRVMLNLHHLVGDEVSLTVLCRELTELYRARRERRSPQLPHPAVHAADFAVWEREYLSGPRLARLEGFWRRQLRGAPMLEVPTDHPRPPRLTFEGECVTRTLPLSLLDQVVDLARRCRVTPYSVFASATAELLHRLSGQDEFVLGVPSENRGMPGSEMAIGCFLNVLPLRVDCSGDPTFAELAGRFHDGLLAAYDHQQLPLARIVEAVEPPRQVNRLPLLGVSCQLQLDGWMPLDLPGCEMEFEIVSHGTARYDMAFHALPKRDHLWFGLEVNTNLYDPDTARELQGRLERGLREITKDPERRLSEYRF